MRIVILLALLLVATTAGATTLEITGGQLSVLFRGTTTSIGIGGDGFTAFAFDDDHIFFNGQPSGSVSFSHISGNSITDMNALVTVGSGTCGGFVQTDFYFCGNLGIFAPDIPLSERVLGASSPPLPFTAVGHFNVGPGYDVVGQGTVVATYTDSLLSPDFRYTFTVPEPSTFALVATGLGLMAYAWRRRQA